MSSYYLSLLFFGRTPGMYLGRWRVFYRPGDLVIPPVRREGMVL